MDPSTINKFNDRIQVLRTLQIDTAPRSSPHCNRCMDSHSPQYPHIFAIGDAADAFGAIMAGHTAYFQGEVAARNILRLVRKCEAAAIPKATSVGRDLLKKDSRYEELETYTPGPPMIKVSLGLVSVVR